MDIGVLGTGVVGRAIAGKLVRVGHRVRMGSRSPDSPSAAEWAAAAGPNASHGTFADAAAFAEEVVFNCTAGVASLSALRLAGDDALRGKILVDVANPLDFSRGMPPTLAVCNTDSLGEQIQRAFPEVRVVKTLNTMNCQVMVDPARVPGEHHVFLGGDDPEAKGRVAGLLVSAFGWPPRSLVDLGGIESARGTEMLLPLWLRLWGALKSSDINFHVAGAPAPARSAPGTLEPVPPPLA